MRAGDAYYALKAGIWFTAAQPAGPWSVATSVPPSIYAIPPTSPIYFVTFVRIYGSTNDVVFEGYTPGYLGAMVAPSGTVVYGTGYDYKPWIGDAWYPAPPTYGVAAAPVFNPRVGYTYAFATGLATASCDGQRAHFHPGYWGHYPCCAIDERQRVSRVVQAREVEGQAGARLADHDRDVRPRRRRPRSTPRPRPRYANSGPQVPIRHMGPERGYDMSMVTNADSANAGPVPPTSSAPTYISANEYYASLAKNGGWDPNSRQQQHVRGRRRQGLPQASRRLAAAVVERMVGRARAAARGRRGSAIAREASIPACRQARTA